MTRRHITATFKDGSVVSRRTAAPYTHASKRRIGTQAGRGPTVRFHTSEAQARAAAGSSGEVATTSFDAPAEHCIVCDGTGSVSYGPSAVNGAYSVVPCHRCNFS